MAFSTLASSFIGLAMNISSTLIARRCWASTGLPCFAIILLILANSDSSLLYCYVEEWSFNVNVSQEIRFLFRSHVWSGGIMAFHMWPGSTAIRYIPVFLISKYVHSSISISNNTKYAYIFTVKSKWFGTGYVLLPLSDLVTSCRFTSSQVSAIFNCLFHFLSLMEITFCASFVLQFHRPF